VPRDQASAVFNSASSTTAPITWSGANPLPGTKVLVVVAANTSTAPTSVTDNGAVQTTFTLDQSNTASAHGVWIYRGDNISLPASGSYVVTATWAAAHELSGLGQSYTGLAAGGPGTAVNNSSGSGTAVTTGACTPLAAGSLFFAAQQNNFNGSATDTLTGAGFVLVGNYLNGTNGQVLSVADQFEAGSAAETCTWTISSATWNSAIVAYQSVGAPAQPQALTAFLRAGPVVPQQIISPPPPPGPRPGQLQATTLLALRVPVSPQFSQVRPAPPPGPAPQQSLTFIQQGLATPAAPGPPPAAPRIAGQPPSSRSLLLIGLAAVPQPATPVVAAPVITYTAGQPAVSTSLLLLGLPAVLQSPPLPVAGPPVTYTAGQPQAALNLIQQGLAVTTAPASVPAPPPAPPGPQQSAAFVQQGRATPGHFSQAPPVVPPVVALPGQQQAVTLVWQGLPATASSPPAGQPPAPPVQPQQAVILLLAGLPVPGNWFQAPPAVLPPAPASSPPQGTGLLQIGLPQQQGYAQVPPPAPQAPAPLPAPGQSLLLVQRGMPVPGNYGQAAPVAPPVIPMPGQPQGTALLFLGLPQSPQSPQVPGPPLPGVQPQAALTFLIEGLPQATAAAAVPPLPPAPGPAPQSLLLVQQGRAVPGHFGQAAAVAPPVVPMPGQQQSLLFVLAGRATPGNWFQSLPPPPPPPPLPAPQQAVSLLRYGRATPGHFSSVPPPAPPLDENLLGGTVTLPLWGGTVTLPPWGGTVTQSLWGGTVTPPPWGGTVTGGVVGVQSDLLVIVADDELIGFQVTYQGAPLNLTGYTLTLYLKANRYQANSAAVATYTIGSGLTITNAANGQFTLDIPKAQLPIPAAQWYRCDVIDGSGNVTTALFGNVTVQAV
jgi:hypothetical protein